MPQGYNTQGVQVTADLSFISNVTLRKKLVEAIETTSELYLVQQDPNYSGLTNPYSSSDHDTPPFLSNW